MQKAYFITILLFIFWSCEDSNFKKVPVEQFYGVWKYQTNNIWNDVVIDIQKTEDARIIGRVLELNHDKFINLFLEVGDKNISNIKRVSNTSFLLTQNMLASELFALYDHPTKTDLRVEFQSKNTLLLGKNGNFGKLVRVK